MSFADVTMSDIEEAAPENSLTDLSDNEIEIEIETEHDATERTLRRRSCRTN